MKPVTVITGAIAVCLGSVLLTESRNPHNYPEELSIKNITNSAEFNTPFENDSPVLKTRIIPDSNSRDIGEINELVLHTKDGKMR